MGVKLIATGLILVSASSAVTAQFGVQMGQSVSSLNGRTTGSRNQHAYKVTVPISNSEFESYTAFATPQTGVCKVWGIGKDYTNDAYGSSVRSAYNRLRSILNEKYGLSEKFDNLKPRALWNEPREWVMSVKQKERTLISYWTTANGNELPQGVEGIELEVSAYESDTAYINLTYEFKNFPRCQVHLQDEQGKGL